MIRPARHDDLGALVMLAERMHAESPRYRDMPFSADKVAALFRALMDGAGFLQVVERDGALVGAMAGFCVESFFGSAKVAGEYGIFLAPGRRGGVAAARLVRAFVAWARDEGAAMIQAGVTTGINPEVADRLYMGLGACRVGNLYEF